VNAVVVHVELDADERTALWTLGAVGRPMSFEALGSRTSRSIALGNVLVILRRLGLVRPRHPVALTSEGVRQAARVAADLEAVHRRELRQLDRLDALAETAAP
jgi:hypothetical protein